MYACVAQEAAQMLVLFSAVIGWVNRGRSRLQTELYSFVLHKKINWNVPHPKRTINPMCSSCQATVSLWCFYLQKWGWLARLVSILGISVTISFRFLQSSNLRFVTLLSFVLSCILTLDWQTRTAITDQPTRCARGGLNASKGSTVKIGPGVQLLQGSKC